MSNNPYQAPSTYTGAPTAELVEEIKPPNVGLISFKWLLICVVSAGPSFFWGLAIGEQQWSAVLGMILGVLTFTVAYIVFECLPFTQRIMRDRHLKLAAQIGYGTRMGISILFPIGLSIDMLVGLAAIGTAQAVTGQVAETQSTSVLWFYGTTLLQGVYLNIILFVYMLFVYALVRLFSRPTV